MIAEFMYFDDRVAVFCGMAPRIFPVQKTGVKKPTMCLITIDNTWCVKTLAACRILFPKTKHLVLIIKEWQKDILFSFRRRQLFLYLRWA
ncbi:hypothetical protein D1X48_25555 [Salmonella enterica]|nr:hypothetical protein [Salmonella enterica]